MVFKLLVKVCTIVKIFSHEQMSYSVDIQQKKSIFISLEDCLSIFFLKKNFISRSYIIVFFPPGKIFECISEGAGRGRESGAFKNVENYLEPEYLSWSTDRKIRLILH